jgi:hypothetical protein
LLKTIKVLEKQRKIVTEHHYFELERRVRLPQGMTVEVEEQNFILKLSSLFLCKLCKGKYHYFSNYKISQEAFLKRKDEVQEEAKQIKEEKEEKAERQREEQEKKKLTKE